MGTTIYNANPYVYEWNKNDKWSQSTITWNNKPAGSGINFTNNNTGYYQDQIVQVEVTARGQIAGFAGWPDFHGCLFHGQRSGRPELY